MPRLSLDCERKKISGSQLTFSFTIKLEPNLNSEVRFFQAVSMKKHSSEHRKAPSNDPWIETETLITRKPLLIKYLLVLKYLSPLSCIIITLISFNLKVFVAIVTLEDV
jgi:hypothetical protein